MTPGQRAYEAYARHMQQQHAMSLWGFLLPSLQEAWEAAAAAVLSGAAHAPPHHTPTLAALCDRVDALTRFVGLDAADHTPLDEAVTIEDRLHTIDTAVELMQGQLAEVLDLLKGKTHG
jgi:hypothetical protein